VWDLKHRFIYANEALLTTWGRAIQSRLAQILANLLNNAAKYSFFSHPWKTTPADRPRAPKAPGITIER
jgi:hypothetical protein